MAANYKSIETLRGGEIDFEAYPDEHGRFGPYGGTYVAETLMAPLAELTEPFCACAAIRPSSPNSTTI